MRLLRRELIIAAILVLSVRAGAQTQGGDARSLDPAGDLAASTTTVLSSAPDAPTYTPLTGSERLRRYLTRAYWSPMAFTRAAVPAFQAHLRNRPPQWRQGAEGYGRRLADRYGRVVIKESYEAAGAAILGHEVRYIRSAREGVLPRMGHAFAATLITYDRGGRRTPHLSRLGAAFATEFTGNLWMPRGYRTRADALCGAGISLGFTSLSNLLHEFSPELKRLVHWK